MFPVSGLTFRVSDFGFRVSGFGFRVSGLGFWVSGFGFGASGLGFWVSGLGVRVEGRGLRLRGVARTTLAYILGSGLVVEDSGSGITDGYILKEWTSHSSFESHFMGSGSTLLGCGSHGGAYVVRESSTRQSMRQPHPRK